MTRKIKIEPCYRHAIKDYNKCVHQACTRRLRAKGQCKSQEGRCWTAGKQRYTRCRRKSIKKKTNKTTPHTRRS